MTSILIIYWSTQVRTGIIHSSRFFGDLGLRESNYFLEAVGRDLGVAVPNYVNGNVSTKVVKII